MAEANGTSDPHKPEDLLKRIAELEQSLAKTKSERDKARKTVNDLYDQLFPEETRPTEEDFVKMLSEGVGPSISEILLEFEPVPREHS